MTDIPFVNELGDALEEAFAAEAARRRRHRGWWRQPRLLIVFAVLAVGCGAAAARTLLSSSTLAIHPVECLAGTTFKSPITFPENNGSSPVRICAQSLNVPAARLIACAGGRSTYVSVFYAAGIGQCRRLGLRALPASYHAAQLQVERLAHELESLQASAYCVSPTRFAAGAKRILDRLGWSEWRVQAGATVQEEANVIGGGDCAALPGGADSSHPPDIMHALDADHRVLTFDLGPPPALARLVQSLAVSIERHTSGRCWSGEALRAYVTRRLDDHHLAAAYAVTAEPPGEELDNLSDHGRQVYYDQGCPAVDLLRTAAGDPRLVDVWIYQRGAAAPPGHGFPPQSAFH
jgi:hypothetical protein